MFKNLKINNKHFNIWLKTTHVVRVRNCSVINRNRQSLRYIINWQPSLKGLIQEIHEYD